MKEPVRFRVKMLVYSTGRDTFVIISIDEFSLFEKVLKNQLVIGFGIV